MFAVDVDKLIESAHNVIDNERSRYDPIVVTLAEYVRDHKLQISSPQWMLDPLHPPLGGEGFAIWSSNALRDATAVANIICKKHTPLVIMKTLLPHEEFEIWVLNRRLVSVLRYPQIKGVDTSRLFAHTQVESKKFGSINFLDAEIEIMEQYHKLYMPFPDSWPKAAQIEDGMFNQLMIRYPIVGGAKTEKPDVLARQLRKHLFDSLQTTDLGILVGHWAVHHLLNEDPRGEKLQLIVPSGSRPEALARRLNNLLRDATHLKINHKTEEVHAPGDYWLRRTTYYLHSDSKEKISLMDTFNSQDYELIPYHIHQGVKIGNAFVLCRFLMIDKWILNVLTTMGLVPAGASSKKMEVIMRRVAQLRKMDKYKWGDQYDGVWKDPIIEKRALIKQQDVKFAPYIPHLYEKQFQRLRVI